MTASHAHNHQSSVHSGPARRLSLWRVLIALGLLGGLFYSMVYGWDWWQQEKIIAVQKPWFAGYVDVTATPHYAFEQLGSTATPQVVLAFIVSDKTNPCVPSWGAAYTLDEAGAQLDLDRRIARLQQQKGQAAISFGGLLNDELALKCTDPEALVAAYRSVIERYAIDTIDLDLENAGLSDQAALQRRATAIAQLQTERRTAGKSLAVWLTLPVAPQGLTENGTTAVAKTLAGGVDLAGINGMTMDYGGSKEESQTMAEASRQALTELHRQLGILYQQAGIHLNSKSLWRKIGVTPMIGQNDVPAEVFTLDDAKELQAFAVDQGAGRMSMWSVNRDTQCGENYVDVKVVSDSCSGVKQNRMDFSIILSESFDGDLTQNATAVTTADQSTAVLVADDPEKSPYQIWQETGTYLIDTKVVWHGNVYEAKWWTKGDMPDNPVLQAWQTPWQLIGPVLPGEKPIPQPKLPIGFYPEWSGQEEYVAGQRILFEGMPFQAKWWNQGSSPAATAANADSSPWLALSRTEIVRLLDELAKQPTSSPSAAVKKVSSGSAQKAPTKSVKASGSAEAI